MSGATVGAVLASRRPRHPVGWLLLALGLSLAWGGVPPAYAAYGLLARPGALPAVHAVVRYWPVTVVTAQTALSFVLLLTPTGSLPSPRWRWWARAMVAAPVVLLLVVTLAGGAVGSALPGAGRPARPPRPRRSPAGRQPAGAGVHHPVYSCRGRVAGRALPPRPRSERLQLRWVALAAVLVVLGGVVVLAALAIGVPGSTTLLSVGAGFCLAVLPLATGAAILQYRLYDLDRIISRTLAYGLLTVLLGSAYAGVVLALGRLLPQGSSLVVAAATLTVAAVFQPARRRIQQAVDRRFNRRRHDAAQTIQAFSDRLRQQVDLDSLTAELRAVVDQTIQPTQASLWLRPPDPSSTAGRVAARERTSAR